MDRPISGGGSGCTGRPEMPDGQRCLGQIQALFFMNELREAGQQ